MAQPDPEFMRGAGGRAVNVMAEPWFSRDHYARTRTALALGLSARGARRGEFEWLQLLTHPEIWVYPESRCGRRCRRCSTPSACGISSDSPMTGSTCRETADGAAYRRGVPGAPALVRRLEERRARDSCGRNDMSERAAGRHLCDAFHLTPGGGDPAFVDALLDVQRERVDAVLPQSSYELLPLADARDRFDAAVLVAFPDAVRRSNDKAETYAPSTRSARRGRRGGGCGDATPSRLRRTTWGIRARTSRSSRSSRPARGFRVLSSSADALQELLTNRPGVAPAMQLEDLLALLPEDGGPELARDGARTREGADDRRHRARRPDRARSSEDARGDARRVRCTSRRSTTSG